MTTRNRLWDLIQAYIDDPGHRYPPKPADLAREAGVSDQVISKWKHGKVLPSVDQLAKFSGGTGIGYLELLTAALIGKGYLPDAPDVEIQVHSQSEALDDFLWGIASPPSGWAGTKLMGTEERGRPLTPLPAPKGGDGNADADAAGGAAPIDLALAADDTPEIDEESEASDTP